MRRSIRGDGTFRNPADMCNQQHETPYEEPSKLDVNSKADVSYWAEKLNVSEEALVELASKVGPQLEALERALGRYTPTSNPR